VTFRSPEVRDRFHKLPTNLQHSLTQTDDRVGKHGFFIYVDEVTEVSEVVIRISEKFISSPVTPFLSDD
jgi:hypothetical protein